MKSNAEGAAEVKSFTTPEGRTFSVIVTEEPEQIVARVTVTRDGVEIAPAPKGKRDPAEVRAVGAGVNRIMRPYRDDPRPKVFYRNGLRVDAVSVEAYAYVPTEKDVKRVVGASRARADRGVRPGTGWKLYVDLFADATEGDSEPVIVPIDAAQGFVAGNVIIACGRMARALAGVGRPREVALVRAWLERRRLNPAEPADSELSELAQAGQAP